MTSNRYSEKEDSYFTHAREEILRMISPGTRRLLDVGCGAGETSAAAKERFGIGEIVGIELHEGAARIARTRLDRVITGDIEEEVLDFPDGYFDCILCADVLEHTREPSAVLGKLRRILGDGGLLIASIPNVRHLVPLMKIICDRLAYEDSGILDRTHLRYFTLHTIRLLFDETGFVIGRIGTNRSISWKFRLLNIISLGLLRPFSVYQYIVAAQKSPSDGGAHKA